MNGRPFSPEEDEKLRHLHGVLGMPWKDVALVLGRSPKACNTRYWHLARAERGLSRESTSRTPDAAGRRCHDCGAPTSDYRCPACRQAWLKKHNVPRGAEEEPE